MLVENAMIVVCSNYVERPNRQSSDDKSKSYQNKPDEIAYLECRINGLLDHLSLEQKQSSDQRGDRELNLAICYKLICKPSLVIEKILRLLKQVNRVLTSEIDLVAHS